jgi:inhibitor of KinA
MSHTVPQIFALGDNAIVIELSNAIEIATSEKLIAMHKWFLKKQFAFVKDVVIGYNSLVVYYSISKLREEEEDEVAFKKMELLLLDAFRESVAGNGVEQKVIIIPVCYAKQYAYDMEELASAKGISEEEIIALHTSQIYRVYMIGFMAGFPYMAHIDEKLVYPRKQRPRQFVSAGSVGIAGSQTGIYPFASPAGWNIIGRTPLQIFDRTKQNPSLLKPGDYVQFISIKEDEFGELTQK